ncbi:ABC transporter permease [Streptomyces sp. RKND-216]|uniref:ABC transporter permease n=1 Tax=Streptomyces sp. RKND-216 TaxID=2562581 RepID=UPI00109E0CED|nr:ABC transporter permease [Streptomyces sp. RKND-216]THA24836.1 ABC transporter permease [Streptomyces sp. RKND-216]
MSTNLSAKVSESLSSKGKDSKPRRRLSWPWILLIIAGALLLLSTLREITGVGGLTGFGTYSTALSWSVPIGLAGLGGLWSERAGVINIGLEGMMIIGTFTAGWIGWQYGPWAAVVAGMAGGALGGLVHAMATVTFGVDHIVSGVAVNILALGSTQFLAKQFFGTPGSEAAMAGGNDRQSPPIEDMSEFSVPLLADWLASLEEQGWFFVSDTAGIARAAVDSVSWVTLLAAGLFVMTFFVLWRSSFGLRLRSCGENPVAAESLGVNVYKYKYAAITMSGALAGLGGAFLALYVHHYQEDQTGGRGYIGLATMIFGNWRPGGVAMGAGIFGFMDGTQLRGGGTTIHALLLVFAVLLVGYGLWKLYKGSRTGGMVAVASGILVALWYAATDTVPREIVEASPYITTLLVLCLATQRLRVPKTIGKPYRKGQGT